MNKPSKRMLVLCPYPQGVAAGQRLKYEQYLDDWRAAGWDIEVSSFMDRATWDVVWDKGHYPRKAFGVLCGYLRRFRDLWRLRNYELVYVFLWATPLGTSLWERTVRRLAPRLIYDMEDSIGTASPPAQSRIRSLLGPLFDRTGKVRFLARSADTVIVASPFLVEPARAMGAVKVACIPPSLESQRIVPAPVGRPENPVPVIGWTGTFSSRLYLEMINPVFRALAQRRQFVLRVIGNFDYALDGVQLDVVRWSAAREAEDLQSLDIGVYPLVDDEWTRGKAGLKIIQYHMAGLPCVASDVPLSRQQLRDDETGFLVSSEAEWVDRLERLIDDRALRRRMGRAGRIEAERLYSRDVVASQYRKVLEQVFDV